MKKPFSMRRSTFCGLLYISLIPLFAIIYYIFPIVRLEGLNYIDSIYFSAVTITTLGYGDILPETQIGKLVVGFQAVSGIIIIGLFLNFLSREWSTESLQKQKAAVEDAEASRNSHVLDAYKIILKPDLILHQSLAYAMITSPEQRDFDVKLHLTDPVSESIKFNDLANAFFPNFSRLNVGVEPAIYEYLELESEIKRKVQDLALSGSVDLKSNLSRLLLNYLMCFSFPHYKQAIIANRNLMAGDKSIVRLLPQMIRDSDGCLPEHQNLIDPYILFFEKFRAKCVIVGAIIVELYDQETDKHETEHQT